MAGSRFLWSHLLYLPFYVENRETLPTLYILLGWFVWLGRSEGVRGESSLQCLLLPFQIWRGEVGGGQFDWSIYFDCFMEVFVPLCHKNGKQSTTGKPLVTCKVLHSYQLANNSYSAELC